MSNIKCPFCQQELDIWHTNRVRMYACPDLTCKGYYMSATKDMWQELIKLMEDKDLSDKIGKLEAELDRTRKALEVTVDALKRIDETRSGIKENLHATNGRALNAGNGFCWATIDDIHNALAKITALEQMD